MKTVLSTIVTIALSLLISSTAVAKGGGAHHAQQALSTMELAIIVSFLALCLATMILMIIVALKKRN